MEKKCGKTMKGLPVSERPYEKVLEKGPASLSDAELLSVILRSGTKNIPVREMAEEILNSGNPPGLAGLLHGAVEDYKEIRGVGEVKAIQLACVGELSARIWKTAASEKTVVFDAPSKVAAFYMEEMRHLEQENLKLLLLNTKNILLKDTTVSIGTVNASCATPREIFIEALRSRPAGSFCSTTIQAGIRRRAGRTASLQNVSWKQESSWESRFWTISLSEIIPM